MSPVDLSGPTMTARLYRIIQPVRDIGEAVVFYRSVLQMPGERVSDGRHYFHLGGTVLALYDPVADGDGPGEWKHHPNQYVYIGVEDLEAVLRRVELAGAVVHGSGIETMPWGERLFYTADPFGNPLCFVDIETLFFGSG